MGLITRAPQVPSLLPMQLKPKVTLLYPTHQVFVKVSRRSMGGMPYRPTSKVVIPSETYYSPSRTRTLWSAKVGPYIGSNVVTFPVMNLLESIKGAVFQFSFRPDEVHNSR